MLDEKPDLKNADRVELTLSNNYRIVFARGSNAEYHDWTGLHENWEYPFTDDEVLEVIGWSYKNDVIMKVFKRLGVTSGVSLKMNSGEYKLHNPFDSLPSPETVAETKLGRTIRLTNHYTVDSQG